MIFLLWFFVGTFAHFSEFPANTSSLANEDVIFRCIGEKSQEPIIYSQWKSNTGSMLGYHQEGTLPGHQGRYSYIKTSSNELHLKISNVNLEDDGEYECQMLHPVGGPIRAKAHLNVLVPPQNVYFSTYQPNSPIPVVEDTLLNITCVVPNVKPVPTVSWYLDGKIIMRESKQTLIAHLNKTSTVLKNLTIKPKRLDNGKVISCEVFQKETQTKLNSMSKLNVLFSPTDPVVKVLTNQETLKAGQNVSLSCTVNGGNPLPDVYWYHQNLKLSSSSVLNTETEEITNVYTFVLTKNDNLAQYECRANNSLTTTPLKKHVKLRVLYPATTLELSGASKVRFGQTISIQCTSSSSNPVSQISWIVNGKPVEQTTQQDVSVENGFISISNVSLFSNQFSTEMSQVNVKCVASNSEGSTETEHTVKITAPPQTPVLSGLKNQPYFEGDVVNVSCHAHGGHPLAELTWFRGTEKINGARNEVSGTSSISVVSLRMDRTMNNQVLRCSATNEALDDPLTASSLISVFYPPRRLVVKGAEKDRHHFQLGKQSRLVCSSLSSNPAAQISWKFLENSENNDGQIGDVSRNETTRDHGYDVENVISFEPSEIHDGSVVYCIANYPGWKHSVNTSFSLNVTFPPKMLVNDPVTITIAEGDSFKENITVKSNPPVSSWIWRKNDMLFDHTIGKIFARGAVLSGKQVTKSDSGLYTLSAINSVGSTNITVKLTVEHSAKIISISGPVIASIGDIVFLECDASGEPMTNKMITWRRNNIITPAEYRSNGKAIVRLNITRDEVGEYICDANNGIGVPDTRKTFILVNSAPKILHDPRFMKTAGIIGGIAKASCNVHAVPTAEFLWEKDGQFIKVNNSKYSIFTTQIDHSTYISTLWIKNIVPDDYAKQVKCVAKNNYGSDSIMIPVIPPTNPEEPQNLSMTNATRNSISISWEPRFDGGSEQLFELKYRNKNSDLIHLVNTSHTNLRISGLETGSSYYFEVRSINSRGFSSFFTEPVNFDTLNEDGTSVEMIRKNKQQWAYYLPLSLVVLIVVVLLVFISCCFVCNRDKKRKLREKTELVRTRGNEDVRQVQMYGAMLGNDHLLQRDNDDRLEMSEDEHSIRTMIEVSPNGYMQPIEPIIFESSGLLDYEFQSRSYHNEMQTPSVRNVTYANTSYPEPPRLVYYSKKPSQQEMEQVSPQKHLSTFINPNIGVRAGPINYAQLDGDLV